jgi:hypothetical protein
MDKHLRGRVLGQPGGRAGSWSAARVEDPAITVAAAAIAVKVKPTGDTAQPVVVAEEQAFNRS